MKMMPVLAFVVLGFFFEDEYDGNGRFNVILTQQLLHHFTGDIGQAKIASHVAVSQARMIKSQTMQERGLQVVNVDFVLRDIKAQIVGFAYDLAALDPTSSEPHAKTVGVMVSPNG